MYAYDKEFRLHIAKHPDRNWAVILQQAWSMKLRDRIYCTDSGASHGHANNSTSNKGNFGHNHGQGHGHIQGNHAKINEPCCRYNCGKCNFGVNCRYEHRCSYEPCRKFGHTILQCRKLAADREQNGGEKREVKDRKEI